MRYQNLEIKRINHDCFLVQGTKAVYFDPYEIPEDLPKADLILVTHEHFDHFSPEDIAKIVTPETTLVAAKQVESQAGTLMLKEIHFLSPGESIEVDRVKIEAFPAYNINKFRSLGVLFHPKDEGRCGFVVELDRIRIYHAGDTDSIPEMAQIKNIDIALLSVSGTYVMTWQEAVEAAKVINPKLTIPMHYGAIVGSEEDAKNFKENAPCPVEVI